ncbi:hypothetical protein C0583_04705 [Candidatus Parcubacteria bacterium]|nr:MAG: hypothetical protein C0583_04705 [Candidatus Parcubacteria bacterium]
MFVFLELSSLVIFAYYLSHAYRNSNLGFLFLLFLFVSLVENLSIVMFAGQEGGYFYNQGFYVFLFETPLFIILFWTCIVYSAYNIIKKVTDSKRQLLFLTPIYVLVLDIIMDVVAVKMNLWTWIGFENGEGFYGVPASNYLGWLILPFSFIFVWDRLYLVQKERIRSSLARILYIFVPIVSFLLFLAIMWSLYKLKYILALSLVGQYYLSIIIFLIFLILGVYNFRINKNQQENKSFGLFNIRYFLHLFSIFGLFWAGLYRDVVLLVILGIILAFEFYVFSKYFDLGAKIALVKKSKI